MSAKETLIDIVAEQLGLSSDEITPDSSLSRDLGADNLDKIELILAVEEEFEIEIPNDEASKLETVQGLLDFVNERLQ